MEKLTAFYFSGTGNTRYVTVRLCEKLSAFYDTESYDICGDRDFSGAFNRGGRILLAYPVYGSSPPIPMRKFVYKYAEKFRGREVIVVATQFMFSGDGAASLGRTIEKFGGKIVFAEHFNMPNNLSDCKIFAVKNGCELDAAVTKTEIKMDRFVQRISAGRTFRRGFNPLSHAIGYFCQRKYWRRGENAKRNALKIDASKCVGCGICARQCPVKNLVVTDGKAVPQGNCVLCYRCVNVCPKKAIVLFGKLPPQTQYKGIGSNRSC